MTHDEKKLLQRIAEAADFGVPYVAMGTESNFLNVLAKDGYVRSVQSVYGKDMGVICWEITEKGVVAL